MKNNKQLLLTLALAMSGVAAHAGNLDLKIPDSATAVSPPVNPLLAVKPATPTVASVAPAAAQPSPAQAAPAAPALQLTPAAAQPVAAPVAKASQKPEPAPVQRTAARPAAAEQPATLPAKPEVVAAPVTRSVPAQSIAEPNKVVVGFGHDKPAVAAEPAPAPAAPAAAPQHTALPAANPFTGKSLTLEGRQTEIEAAKLDTELLSERLKQAAMLADLTYLPVKKQAEVALLPNVQKAQGSQASPAREPQAAAVTPAPKKIVKTKKKHQASEMTPPLPAPVEKAAEPALTVSSISINGSNASIVLEADGNVMTAHQGETTPFGVVRVVDSGTVMVGARQLKLRNSVISRMAVSDPPVADPRAAVVTAPRVTTPAPAQVTLPPLPNLPPPPRALSFNSK